MSRNRIVLVAVALAAVLAVGALVLSQLFLAGDDVPALGLDTPAPSSAAATQTPAAGAASPGGETARPGASPGPTSAGSPGSGAGSAGADDLAGTWMVASGVAGYRVRETFLQQNADTDAVGRSEGVTGSVTVEGESGSLRLTAGQLTVDMTSLRSDRPQRDSQIRRRGPETDAFPTSTFELAGPVALPADFGTADVAVMLPGKLTLHGVTRNVEVAAQARLEADGTAVVAGSLPILFSDYGMEPPSVANLISVRDQGTMEFRIILAKG
jgi:polyisoprenoid-binding protein YceI